MEAKSIEGIDREEVKQIFMRAAAEFAYCACPVCLSILIKSAVGLQIISKEEDAEMSKMADMNGGVIVIQT